MGSGGSLCNDRAVVRGIHVGKCCRPGHTRQTRACPWASQSPELGYAKVTLCTSVGCLPFLLGKSGRWVPGTCLYYFYNFCNYFNIVKTNNTFSGSLSLSWLKLFDGCRVPCRLVPSSISDISFCCLLPVMSRFRHTDALVLLWTCQDLSHLKYFAMEFIPPNTCIAHLFIFSIRLVQTPAPHFKGEVPPTPCTPTPLPCSIFSFFCRMLPSNMLYNLLII